MLHGKLRASFLGKQGIWPRIHNVLEKKPSHKRLIWFHAASAGEFLQAKPVILEFHEAGWFCFLSVASVSGYNWLQRQAPAEIDAFDYLPLDLISSNRKLIKMLRPEAIIFSKTDLWPNLVDTAAWMKVPLFVIGARAPRGKLAALYYRSLYKNFTGLYTATPEDARFWENSLGKSSGPEIKAIGDSRFDTVAQHGKQIKKFTWKFDTSKARVIVLGSVWAKDMAAIGDTICNALLQFPELRVIAAPHEVDLQSVKIVADALAQYASRRYSTVQPRDIVTERVLIVDTLGDLHSLYSLADIAYVGGGFSGGIHNILEPASMGAAVVFGPNHRHFPEAHEMKHYQAARSAANPGELTHIMVELLSNKQTLKEMQKNASDYVKTRANTAKPYYEAITQAVLAAKKLG